IARPAKRVGTPPRAPPWIDEIRRRGLLRPPPEVALRTPWARAPGGVEACMPRPRPEPPRTDLIRRPSGAFGWLDAELLHAGWLARLGPEGTAALTLLALAADARGVSFYGRSRMAERLGLTRAGL